MLATAVHACVNNDFLTNKKTVLTDACEETASQYYEDELYELNFSAKTSSVGLSIASGSGVYFSASCWAFI